MKERGHGEREWRGFANEGVRLASVENAEERHQCKRKVVEIPPPSFADRSVEPHAVYPHAFPNLAGIEFSSIRIEDASNGIVGHCGHNLDVMTETPQLSNNRRQSYGSGAGLRREVLGQKQNFQC